jgi:hypothetical protein
MGMYSRETLYYEEHPKTPDATLQAAFKRAKELGIGHFVTASASGSTALRASELAAQEGLKIQIVCVANPVGWTGPGINLMKDEMRRQLEDRGVKIVQGSRPLNGLDMAFQNRLGGVSLATAVLEAYLRFSEGVFHAIQVAIMAADAGAVPTDEDIIAEALYDTALVLRPANLRRFFDLNVREIIAMAAYPTTKLSWE